jgi:hypothetical protein
MEANEILPAIPRQKVKHSETGEIADVLGATHDGTTIAVRVCKDGDTWIENWIARYCEPVPEEPRPLRVGDKVTLPSWGANVTRYGIITGIESQQGYEQKTYYVDGDLLYHTEEIRLASPQECKDYFN